MQEFKNKNRGAIYWILPTILVGLLVWMADVTWAETNPVAYVLIGLDGLTVEDAWTTEIPMCPRDNNPRDVEPIINDVFNVRYAERFGVFFVLPSTGTTRPTYPQIGIREPCSGSPMFVGFTEAEGRGEWEWIYKAETANHDLGEDRTVKVPSPRIMDVMYYAPWNRPSDSAPFDGLEAWTVAQRLRVVQRVATPKSSVLIVLYPRTLGAYKPSSASWLVIVTGQ